MSVLARPLAVVAIGLLTLLLTSVASLLATGRPSFARFEHETGSLLAADYSADLGARKISPLDPAIIRAAAADEAGVALPTPTPTGREEPEEEEGSPPPAGPVETRPPAPTTTPVLAPTTLLRTATPPPATATPVRTATPALLPSATVPVPTATVVPPIATIVLPTATSAPPATSTPLPTATSAPPPTSTPPPTATSTPQPTATPLVWTTLTPLPCALLPSQKSEVELAPTSVRFENRTSATIRVYWIDHDGGLQLMETVAPVASVTVSTYVTHPWVVTTSSGECIAIYAPVPTPGVAVID